MIGTQLKTKESKPAWQPSRFRNEVHLRFRPPEQSE